MQRWPWQCWLWCQWYWSKRFIESEWKCVCTWSESSPQTQTHITQVPCISNATSYLLRVVNNRADNCYILPDWRLCAFNGHSIPWLYVYNVYQNAVQNEWDWYPFEISDYNCTFRIDCVIPQRATTFWVAMYSRAQFLRLNDDRYFSTNQENILQTFHFRAHDLSMQRAYVYVFCTTGTGQRVI